MEPEVKKEHKYLPVLITALVMLFVVTFVSGGVWYYMDQQANKTADDNAKQVVALRKQIDNLNKKSAPNNTNDPTAGWKTYSDKTLGYTVKYPPNWTATTINNNDGTLNSSYLSIKKDNASPSVAGDSLFQITKLVSGATWPISTTGCGTITSVKIAGTDGQKMTCSATSQQNGAGVDYYFVHNSQAYEPVMAYNIQDDGIGDLIVSTISF